MLLIFSLVHSQFDFINIIRSSMISFISKLLLNAGFDKLSSSSYHFWVPIRNPIIKWSSWLVLTRPDIMSHKFLKVLSLDSSKLILLHILQTLKNSFHIFDQNIIPSYNYFLAIWHNIRALFFDFFTFQLLILFIIRHLLRYLSSSSLWNNFIFIQNLIDEPLDAFLMGKELLIIIRSFGRQNSHKVPFSLVLKHCF